MKVKKQKDECTMLLGVLRMPFDDHDDLHLMQLRSRCLEAADEIEQLRQRLLDIRYAYDYWKSELPVHVLERIGKVLVVQEELTKLEAAEAAEKGVE